MIKRSPSRNQRSKGIKVKHVLQIILLLGVCFWLIYQVKHSHDKKKEFDENNASVSVGTQTAYQIQKLGRKDLHPGKDEVNQNEKHQEEVEDENIVEDDENKHELNEQGGKQDSKHGVRGREEEQEEDENKSEEMEDERGGGDDEIDENDLEKSELDTDRDEEFMDEEKEKEEESDTKDNENSEDQEKEGSVENHNTHEAREEHYKGDDASSAVTHDTHTTSSETETVSLANTDDNSGMSIAKSENKSNYTEESSGNQTDLVIKVTEVELTRGGTSNATSSKETGNNSLSNPADSSLLNGTATTHSDNHSDASSNLTVAIPGASNNMTGTGDNTSSEQNKVGIFFEPNHAPNDMVNTTVTADVKNVQTEELEQGGNRVSEENLPDSKATAPMKTENGDAAADESANPEGSELEKTTRPVASNETENKGNTETSESSKAQNNSYMKENTDATHNEKLKDGTQTGETGESSDSFSGKGTTGSVDHNATDSSDSHILKDVTEVQTDPDTLPDIRNEGNNSDKTATE